MPEGLNWDRETKTKQPGEKGGEQLMLGRTWSHQSAFTSTKRVTVDGVDWIALHFVPSKGSMTIHWND